MSVWDNVVGQQSVVARLQKVIDQPQALAQSWLFVGPPGSGRSVLARDFAQALECPNGGDGTCEVCHQIELGSFPDVRVLTTQAVTIGIDDVRALVAEAEQMPSVGQWKIFIIEDVDRMSERTTNVLLKSVEEPAEHTIWLLCAPSAQDVLPTIRSRCRLVTLAVPQAQDIAAFLARRYPDLTSSQTAQIARISQGHIGIASLYATHRDMLAARANMISGVISMTRSSDAVLLARQIDEDAKAQAQQTVDERVEKQQLDFKRKNGLEEKKPVPAALRPQYNKIGKADEKKREVTRSYRDIIDRILTDISSVYRDISVIHNDALESVGIVNLENNAQLQQLAVKLTRSEATQRLEAVEVVRRRIQGNGAPLLDLEAMLCTLIPPFKR